MIIEAPISLGELVDKITILKIKIRNISDPLKLENVRKELKQLISVLSNAKIPDIYFEFQSLQNINAELWDIEDKIRIKESKKEFDQEFIKLARSVYVTNDKRAKVKKEINLKVGSDLVEEKSYEQY